MNRNTSERLRMNIPSGNPRNKCQADAFDYFPHNATEELEFRSESVLGSRYHRMSSCS